MSLRLRPFWATLSVLLVLGLLSCDSSSSSPSGPDVPDQEVVDTVTITLLYTNDEHGWIEEGTESDGAAKLLGIWKSVEGYRADGPFVVASGGDNWTGPAISTWFQGESTVEVMNAMGYTASTVGNHEFDFTVTGLEERIQQATFPYLSSNIRLKSTGTLPGFATPFITKTVAGVDVGMVGLTTTSTPRTAFPTYVEDFDFISYQEALSEWVPKARAAGADLIVVLAHACLSELRGLVPLAKTLGVSVMGGGHCHESAAEVIDGVALVEGGSGMKGYGKVKITFDRGSGEVVGLVPSTAPNQGGSADAGVRSIVEKWQGAAAAELSSVIGFVDVAIPNGSAPLYNLITDSWLFSVPEGDIAMTNAGGVRQGIPAGDITLGTIVGVLPFQNNVIELELTGEQVVASLSGDMIVAGIRMGVGGVVHADGTPLKPDSVYQVLTTDFLYAQANLPLSSFDSEPYLTGLTYYQPTVLYLKSLETHSGNSLDHYLDYSRRR